MNIKLSREYMSESYDQVCQFGSKRLRVERLIGSTLMLFGCVLFFYVKEMIALPIALVAVGVFELLSNQMQKYFWLRRHARSKLMNAEIVLEITESGIDSQGPFSTGHFKWSGIEKAIRTPKGILIWPQKGVYWYLPERIAGKDTINLVLTKITQSNNENQTRNNV